MPPAKAGKKLRAKETAEPTRGARRGSSAAKLGALGDTVGDFMRYWGFRRIHGQLWTQIYLSPEPLSGADLMRRIRVSKALVSPALKELQEFELIFEVEADGRTKKYCANADVYGVIRRILEKREKVLIGRAMKNFEAISESSLEFEPARLRLLGEMISAAVFAIDFVVRTAEQDCVGAWSGLEPAP